MAGNSNFPNFNNQNNLYPEPQNGNNPKPSKYKPIINTPINTEEAQSTPDEEYYRPITPVPDPEQDYNYQSRSAFDVKVNPKQTQQAFNKDIRVIDNRTPFQKFLAALSKKWWLVLIVVLAISVVSLALWQLLKPNTFRPGPFNNVQTVVTAPQSSASGTPNTWKIEIKNNETVDLLNVELNLKFDSQFRYNRAITPTPSDPKGDSYVFSRIDAVNKSGGTSSVIVEFEGIITGRVDEQTYLEGTLIYTPEPLKDFSDNRESVNLEQAKTTISRPLVTATINPESTEVESGTETRIRVNFENLSDKDINDIRLKVNYPGRESFEYISSELLLSNSSSPRINPTDSNNVWDISTMPAAGQQELTVVGRIKGTEGTANTFSVDIQIKRADETYQNIFTTSKDVKVISRPLLVSTLIQGKEENKTFRPGETLTFQINYKNQGQGILNNVQIISTINDPAEILDFSTLKFNNGVTGNESNKTITWGGQSASFLNSMSPGLEGTIAFNIQVKSKEKMINPSLNQGSYTIIPKVDAKADNIKPVFSQGETYRALGDVTFVTDEITYRAHPTDPNKRIYTIKWKVNTAQNNLKDVNIATASTLPASSWQPSSVKPSTLTYNSGNGQISLKVSELESLYGVNKDSYIIQFDMEVAKQTGGFNGIEIHKEVNLTATDSFTGEVYSRKLPAITAKN